MCVKKQLFGDLDGLNCDDRENDHTVDGNVHVLFDFKSDIPICNNE